MGVVGKYQSRAAYDHRADQDAQYLLNNLKQQ